MDADRRAEEDRQRAGAPPQQAFFVGDQVQEREFGFSSPATVTRVNNNGTYDVQCNDGATKHFMAPADLEAVRLEGGARSPKSRKRRVSWCDESGVADLATVFDSSDRLTDKRASVVDTMSMHMNRKTEVTFAVEDRVRVRTEEGMAVGRIDAIDNTGAGAYQVMLLDGEGVDTGASIRLFRALSTRRSAGKDAAAVVAEEKAVEPDTAAVASVDVDKLPKQTQQLFRALSMRRGVTSEQNADDDARAEAAAVKLQAHARGFLAKLEVGDMWTLQEMQALVGRRIHVRWDDDDQGESWFSGTIVDFTETSEHVVIYDDGDQEHHDLQQTTHTVPEVMRVSVKWVDGD
eukprot:g2604.t1